MGYLNEDTIGYQREDIMTRIYWIRHGQTETNATDRFDGDYNADLTEEGQRQVSRLAERLARAKLNQVIGSDLRRALRTAEAVAAPHGLAVDQLPALRERRFGQWEGLSVAEIKRRWPEAYRGWAADYVAGRPEGGETFQEMAARVYPAIDGILAACADQAVAVVAHGGTIRAALCHALDLPLDRARRFKTENAGLTIIEYGYRYGAKVVLVNDTSHVMASQGARV